MTTPLSALRPIHRRVSLASAIEQPGPSGPACGRCKHFTTAPRDLERDMPGLAAMGSGYSAVRAGDGLCRLHDRYLCRTHFCGAFQAMQ
jgi:hypothetical protein